MLYAFRPPNKAPSCPSVRNVVWSFVFAFTAITWTLFLEKRWKTVNNLSPKTLVSVFTVSTVFRKPFSTTSFTRLFPVRLSMARVFLKAVLKLSWNCLELVLDYSWRLLCPLLLRSIALKNCFLFANVCMLMSKNVVPSSKVGFSCRKVGSLFLWNLA